MNGNIPIGEEFGTQWPFTAMIECASAPVTVSG